MPAKPARAALILTATALIALSACGGDEDSATDASLNDVAGEASAITAVPDGGMLEASGAEPTAEESAPAIGGDRAVAGVEGVDFGTVGRDVIVEMHVVVSSDDIQRSVAAITADASSLGGGIASSDIDYGTASGDPANPGLTGGHAVLVVKVPPDAVSRMLDGLESTGDVVSVDQSAQDVSEQLVDLDVRIANARQSVTNVRTFMEQAADLNDLVTLEAELTRRQTELEQLEAQQRNLGERVALATITVELIPPTAVPPAPAEEPEKGVGDAFADGWDAFVAVVFGIVVVIAVLAPFLALGAVVGAAAWIVARRRSPNPARPAHTDERHATPMPAPTAPTTTGTSDDDVNEPLGASASRDS